MMDMFTIILVFLLKSYSATGKLISIPEGYTLPESIAEETPVLAVNISVDDEYIMVDDALRIRVDQCRTGYGPPYLLAPCSKFFSKRPQNRNSLWRSLASPLKERSMLSVTKILTSIF